MRALTREPQRYVISTEWERLHPESKARPTVWVIVVQTGEQMLKWTALREQIDGDKRMLPEDKAQRFVDLDNDLFAASIKRVEDWETGRPAPDDYETVDDPKRIREIVASIGKLEREELGTACVLQGRLSVGEPDRLRSQLTSYSGASPSRPVSETSTVSDAQGSENGGPASV